MNSPTFIIGTGRCGSTMLSNMLRQHPKILSISEFFCFTTDFGGRIYEAFSEQLIDGKTFFQLFGEISPRSNLLVKHDVAPSEFIYPFNSSKYRFSSKTGIPPILNVTLPHLTANCDDLFDEIKLLFIGRSTTTVREHYNYFFDWLQHKFNKSLWIERTGGSLVIVEQLLNTFPNARFIHLVRDGRDCAISMSNHLGFRLFVLGQILTEYLGIDPYKCNDRTNLDKLPLKYKNFLPENFDRQAFLEYQLPLSICGELWSQQILNGLKVFNELSQERVLTLVYEDLLDNPELSLQKLALFLGKEFVNSSWIEKAAGIIRRPRSSWKNLPVSSQYEVTEKCQIGFEVLKNQKHGINYAELIIK